MTQLFLLVGETGEYSDFQEWIVRAYTTREAAQADAVALNEIAKISVRDDSDDSEASYDQRLELYTLRESVAARLKAHDLKASVSPYTGTTYRVEVVDVAGSSMIKA